MHSIYSHYYSKEINILEKNQDTIWELKRHGGHALIRNIGNSVYHRGFIQWKRLSYEFI